MFLEFLESVCVLKTKASKQLISGDTHTGKGKYKFTHSVELVPICKGDVVGLPKQVAAKHGQISPVCVVEKVSNVLTIVDPASGQPAAGDS